MNVYGLKAVDTIGSMASFACSLRYFWNDTRLKWNPEDFGGIETTRVSSNPELNGDFIWTPDIESY